MITITDFALEKLKEIAANEGLEEQYVRIKLKGGGCAGMQTDMSFEPNRLDTDELFQFDSIKIVIDPVSLQYLENTSIDFIDAPFGGGGFKFNNPNVTSSCGCGKSQSF